MRILVAKKNVSLLNELKIKYQEIEKTENTAMLKISAGAFQKLKNKLAFLGINKYAFMNW